MGFGLVVWRMFGSKAAGEYYAGYVIEKSLAVDNVFVFALIFAAFAVPRAYQHRVLFFGVLGALVMRAAFIAGGALLIDRFAWVLYVFGGFLVVTGIQMFRTRNSHSEPPRHPVLRLTRRIIPSTPSWHGAKFWVKENGRWLATPLFTVLVLVETTDLIFAVDSIRSDLRRHPGSVPRLHQQRLRDPRPARHVLPARRPHAPLRLPQGRIGRGTRVSSASRCCSSTSTRSAITLSLSVIGALVIGSVAASLWRTKNDSDETSPPPNQPARRSPQEDRHDHPPRRSPHPAPSDAADPEHGHVAPGDRRATPAVTLLMLRPTPASRMLPRTAERLLGMAREAEARLTSESLPGIWGTALRPIADLAEEAGRGPATEAIAIFVSATDSRVVHLNLLVADRVAVDPTFATRDLVRALHRTPRHVVLTLSQHEGRLFEGVGGDLHPAPGRRSPPRSGRRGAAQRGERGRRVQPRRSFYRDVDRALGAYLRVHQPPRAGWHRAQAGRVSRALRQPRPAGWLRPRQHGDGEDDGTSFPGSAW